MLTTIYTPYNVLNAFALFAALALSAFIASRILATAPALPVHAQTTEAAHIVLQESYAGIIAWVNANEIKITDNFGVSRAIAITKDTHILLKGYPVGAATVRDLRVFDHVRITTIKDGADERAETIQVP